MIVVEKQLTKAFDNLPNIEGFKPVYKWGNKDHLIKQLKLFGEEAKSPYPLIYQTSNSDSDSGQKNYTETDLVLILATRVLQTELLNENRWAMSYEKILWPLANNIETIFKKSQMFVWDNSFTKTTYPNYGNGEENFTADIWDAMELKFNGLKITTNCLGNFKY